jgi:hypothetical protein
MRRRLFGSRDSNEPGLSERDKAMFAEFRESGTDLSIPRRIDHSFAFPSENAAKRLAARLSPPLRCIVQQRGDAWTVQASMTMPVTEDLIQQTRPRFEAIAKEFGGTYDGWGAEPDAAG